MSAYESASGVRTRSSACTLVATRTCVVDGQTVIRGVTRVEPSSSLASSAVFTPLDSARGRAALRGAGGSTRAKVGEFELWFVDGRRGA